MSARVEARVAAAAAMVGLLSVLVHSGSLFSPFVYDDSVTVLNNPSLAHPINALFVLVYDRFRPLTNLTFAFDFLVWGKSAVGFHATNLLFHGLNSVLLMRVATRVFGAGAPRSESGPHALMPAAVVAVLFGIHPLLTETVGYVSSRSELLCATFFLLGLISGITALDQGGRRRWTATVLFWVAATASKETGVLLPLVLFAYDRLLQPGTAEDRARRLRRMHLPLAALVVGAGLLRVGALISMENRMLARPVWQNVIMQGGVLCQYLALFLLPLNQTVMHPVSPVTTGADPRILGWLAIGVIGFCLYRLRRQFPVVAFGAVWFLLLMLPSSSVVPLKQEMAEHRTYVAAAGLMVAVTSAGWLALQSLLRQAGKGWTRTAEALLLVGVVALGVATVRRNQVWRTAESLWLDAVQKAPLQWEAHYALGDAYRESGRCRDAVPELEEANRLRPDEPRPLNNLGICLTQMQQYEPARQAFQKAIVLKPADPVPHTNLGMLDLVLRDRSSARHELEEAVRLDPTNTERRRMLTSLSP